MRGPLRVLLGFAQDLPIRPVPAVYIIAKISDNEKDVEYISLSKTYRYIDIVVSKIIQPSLLL